MRQSSGAVDAQSRTLLLDSRHRAVALGPVSREPLGHSIVRALSAHYPYAFVRLNALILEGHFAGSCMKQSGGDPAGGTVLVVS